MNRTHIVRDNPNIKEGIRYWKNRPEGAGEVLTQYQGAEFGITSVKSIFLPIRTFELCVPLSERTLHDPSLLHLPLAPTVPAEEKLETRKYDSLFARRYLWADSRIMCDVVVPAGKNLLFILWKDAAIASPELEGLDDAIRLQWTSHAHTPRKQRIMQESTYAGFHRYHALKFLISLISEPHHLHIESPRDEYISVTGHFRILK